MDPGGSTERMILDRCYLSLCPINFTGNRDQIQGILRQARGKPIVDNFDHFGQQEFKQRLEAHFKPSDSTQTELMSYIAPPNRKSPEIIWNGGSSFSSTAEDVVDPTEDTDMQGETLNHNGEPQEPFGLVDFDRFLNSGVEEFGSDLLNMANDDEPGMVQDQNGQSRMSFPAPPYLGFDRVNCQNQGQPVLTQTFDQIIPPEQHQQELAFQSFGHNSTESFSQQHQSFRSCDSASHHQHQQQVTSFPVESITSGTATISANSLNQSNYFPVKQEQEEPMPQQFHGPARPRQELEHMNASEVRES